MFQGEFDCTILEKERYSKRTGYRWKNCYHPQLANRVAFTTGSVIKSEVKVFLEQSRRPCLPKPFDHDELKTFIRDALERIE